MVIWLALAVLTVFVVVVASQGALDALQELDRPRDDYPKRDPWRNNVGKGE